MKKIIFMLCTFGLAQLSHAGEVSKPSCGIGESKFLYDQSTRFQDRIYFENLSLCLSGSKFRIIAQLISSTSYSDDRDFTAGLCKAMGFGKTVSTDSSRLQRPEKIAYFADDGKFSGVHLIDSEADWRIYSYKIVGSLTCEL